MNTDELEIEKHERPEEHGMTAPNAERPIITARELAEAEIACKYFAPVIDALVEKLANGAQIEAALLSPDQERVLRLVVAPAWTIFSNTGREVWPQ